MGAALLADDTRERRCIATGAVLPDAQLVRFVVDPEGSVIPDIAAKLPGRGLWVKADGASLALAVRKNAFSRAAGASVSVASDLGERTERQLIQRMLSDLGLACRSGQVVFGYENVVRAFGAKAPPLLLLEASDGSPDGRRKILSAARTRGVEPAILDCFASRELSLALGRENVVHAAIKSGRLAERLIVDAGRLSGLKRIPQDAAIVNSDRHERDE
jgi:uncharacterized protein